MTYLELVQALHRESGAGGTQPTTVTNLTGEANRLAGWIRSANFEIQSLWENWKFLLQQDSRPLTPTVNTLVAPTDMGDGLWDDETFRLIRVGSDVEEPLMVYEYEEVKGEQVDISSGPPWRAVIMPDNSLRFEGTPDAADTFKADYFREGDEDELAAGGDVSSIPVRFHKAILGLGLMMYAEYEGAQEIAAKGERLFSTYLARLENSQLPNKRKARFRTGGGFVVRAE